MLSDLGPTHFSARLNETFRISADSIEAFDATLIQVDEMDADSTPQDQNSSRRAFSIVFRGPKETILPQAIYRVEHDGLGTLDLFLVTIGPDKKGMQYEAVFT